MALIGARRQRRLGFQPIPLLRKAENRLFVVSDWSALDRQLQERRGESQSLGERLSRWTLEGSDPREDPRVLSRNLGLGDPWDIHLADYVDERVRLLRKQFPRAEHLFMEALELEKDINVSKVREASIEIVHKLRAAGWSRKQILGEGIDPDLDPLEAKVREAVKQTEAARRQIEEAGRVRAAAEARAEALLKENASLHAKSREAKKQVEASNLQAAEAKRAQAAAEARVEAVSKSNTELQAQVRVAGKMPSRPPEFTANDIIDALNAANNAVNTGKGLMNVLTSRQREIVRIMPATRLKCLESMGRFEVEMQRNLKGELELVREPNPTAGRLGLTTTVAQFVEGQILRAMEILSTDPIELSVADFESARSQLLAYTAVQKSARISLGFAPETPAQAAPEQEPAHTMAP
jgi:hypothetical protein